MLNLFGPSGMTFTSKHVPSSGLPNTGSFEAFVHPFPNATAVHDMTVNAQTNAHILSFSISHSFTQSRVYSFSNRNKAVSGEANA